MTCWVIKRIKVLPDKTNMPWKRNTEGVSNLWNGTRKCCIYSTRGRKGTQLFNDTFTAVFLLGQYAKWKELLHLCDRWDFLDPSMRFPQAKAGWFALIILERGKTRNSLSPWARNNNTLLKLERSILDMSKVGTLSYISINTDLHWSIFILLFLLCDKWCKFMKWLDT